MRLVLDTGALLALERGDVRAWRRMREALKAGEPPLTHGGVVGQAWRGGGPRQTLLAKALAAVEVRPLDEVLGRAAGELMARAGARDVVDAALVLLVKGGARIVTSDADDIERLVEAAGLDLEVITA